MQNSKNMKTQRNLIVLLIKFQEIAMITLLFVGDINSSDDLTLKDHIDSSKNLFILIGPEGDFDEDELLAINKCKNAVKFSLGKSILRSETAAISAISIFNYLTRQI